MLQIAGIPQQNYKLHHTLNTCINNKSYNCIFSIFGTSSRLVDLETNEDVDQFDTIETNQKADLSSKEAVLDTRMLSLNDTTEQRFASTEAELDQSM